MQSTRIDKWLWAARFFKTRSLATDEVQLGRVQWEGRDVKPAKEVKAGDTLTIWQGKVKKVVQVLLISEQRGPAPVAQLMYAETPDSVRDRLAAAEQQRLSPEPAHTIAGGRPTKRDRRALQTGWNERWSASLD
ncbi:RNA-binding S4 domain-containing protein [Rhodoferax sp. TBRC 17198]|jgi:ribosome-associated heat shock protein Hsp15|uniref:RNA-binding S4 domain-containing protein n=1 Tax=Rhodoferax potami TaxID=3068338 RepID=UPI0028BDEB0A|nr:RNA-binding S4 domain-containing protein [Rhodoferax sp. TBRC 17198]MDT7521671.1 RNA-binding S4 domain-containing protein [Rhodoferax sp. TBRC 17198]